MFSVKLLCSFHGSFKPQAKSNHLVKTAWFYKVQWTWTKWTRKVWHLLRRGVWFYFCNMVKICSYIKPVNHDVMIALPRLPVNTKLNQSWCHNCDLLHSKRLSEKLKVYLAGKLGKLKSQTMPKKYIFLVKHLICKNNWLHTCCLDPRQLVPLKCPSESYMAFHTHAGTVLGPVSGESNHLKLNFNIQPMIRVVPFKIDLGEVILTHLHGQNFNYLYPFYAHFFKTVNKFFLPLCTQFCIYPPPPWHTCNVILPPTFHSPTHTYFL